MSNSTPSNTRKRFLLAIVFAAMGLPSINSHALTDLSDGPLASGIGSSVQVKPNIFFILDDSGSMDRDYMPDDVDTTEAGYRNHMCNTIHYNPAVTYVVPQDSTSTNLHNASPATFTAACSNGYSGSSCNTNLGTRYYWQYLGTNTNLLWPASGGNDCTLGSSVDITTRSGICSNGSSLSASTYSNPTDASCVSEYGAGRTLIWKRVTVTSASSDAQNYANWYSYYRTRLMMMKAAAGRAFQDIGDNYRVGFMTISPGTYGNDSGSSGAATGSSISSSKFLKIDDFDAAHKADWYTKLYSQTTSSFTPLRSALSTAGRYFAGKNDLTSMGMIPTQADDPVQYSCQQNFTILTTDGYWNGGSGRRIDGTSQIGNQDGVLSELDAYNPSDKKFAVSPRPIFDGAQQVYVWNTATNAYQYASCTTPATQQKTVQWQSRTVSTQLQQRNSSLQIGTATLQRSTSNNSGSSWSSWSNVPSCIWDNSGSSRTRCRYIVSSWTNTGSCTSTTDTNTGHDSVWSGPRAACQYNSWSAWSNVGSCNPVAQSVASPYTVGTAVECQTATIYGPWTNTTGVCTPSATLQCQSVDVTAWTNVTTCTPVAPNASGQEILCQSVASTSGRRIQYRATRTARSYPGPNQTGTIISTTTTTDSSWSNYDATCYPLGLEPAFPPTTVIGSGPPTPPSGCTSGSQVWPCETSSSSGGSSNSLADVAQYYYKTDLRSSSLGNCAGAVTGVNVCDNNVPKTGDSVEDDKASWQHMTTFTMGLGLSGQLPFSPTYKTDTSGTFAQLRDPASGLNWPVPTADSATAIDDLWHAAVDGRGQYFSANNPDTVVTGLTTALAGVQARVGSAAAAATSNLEPVAGDNFIYIPKYVTLDWTGELEARQIDPNTGTVSAVVDWSARDKLDLRTYSYTNTSTTPATVTSCDTRTIKLFRAGTTNNMVDFKWNTDSCGTGNLPSGNPQTTLNATEQAYFDSTEVALLSQYPDMTDGTFGTANQRSAAAGGNLVNFLRGHRAKEGFVANDINKLYRSREHVMGDIINSKPIGVRVPFANYDDGGYAAFKTANANRTAVLYVAANDGMLHAFRGTDGVEQWAFIPSAALPNLYALASANYATQHKYSVDGAPVASDVFDATTSTWKTILVGGLNKGGKSYYALDITDPSTPKALWEFKYSSTCYDGSAATAGADCHLGYTFGNPIIGKLGGTDANAGRWAVFVTSGHNNVTSISGDGQGYLYVLDANTGQIIYKISTGAGDSTNPSGLSRITAWVTNASRDNTVERIYGVDLLGNIWRFDVNDTLGLSGQEASKVAQVVDGAGNPQPITTRPILAENDAGEPVVYVATGKYLGITDLSNTQTQTVWSIRDPLTSTVTGLRGTLARLTLTTVGDGATAYRTGSCSAQCSSTEGWFVDLPDSGERVNVDMQLVLGSLIVASNVPTTNACDIGGYAWLNTFNYRTGAAVASSANNAVSGKVLGGDGSQALVVGVNVFRTTSGKLAGVCVTSAGDVVSCNPPFDPQPPEGKTIGWREILQ